MGPEGWQCPEMPRISFISVVTTSCATASIKPPEHLTIYHGSGPGTFLAPCLRPASWPHNVLLGFVAPSAQECTTQLPEHWSTSTLCKLFNDSDGNPPKAGAHRRVLCDSMAFIQSSGYQDRTASCSVLWTWNRGFVQVCWSDMRSRQLTGEEGLLHLLPCKRWC